MPPEQKKSGLHKDISSIFSGLEEVVNGRAGQPAATSAAPAAKVNGGAAPEAKANGGAAPEARPAPPAAPRVVREVLTISGAFPQRRNAWVGLDIGQSSIKIVQVIPNDSGWEIGGFAVLEIRLEQDEEGLEKKEFLLRHLKELCAQTKCLTLSHVCSIRGDGVNTGLIPMARMPKKELESACRLEVKRRVAFNVEKAFLQSHLVPEDSARPGAKQNFIVTVARRESVARRLNILRDAGIQVAALLPIPFAWKNMLIAFRGGDPDPVRAVVDIGSDRTLVSIYQGSQLQFCREFDLGGDQITEAVIQAGQSFGEKVDISWDEAERIKKGKNLLKSSGSDPVKGSLNSSQVVSMVRPVLERIVQETKRSLEYYGQLFRGADVGQIILSGGGSLLDGFVPFFQERMKPPVSLIELPPGITFHSSVSPRDAAVRIVPRLSKALALSLSRKWEVNFLPTPDKVLQSVLRSRMVILIALGLLFLMSIAFYRFKTSAVPSWRKTVERQQKQLVAMTKELSVYDRLEELKKQLAAGEGQGKISSPRQVHWEGVLKELGKITPGNIVLTRIAVIEGSVPLAIVCEGSVVKPEASLHSTVTEFLVRVGNSPFFRDVGAISEDVVKGSFRFNCTLVY